MRPLENISWTWSQKQQAVRFKWMPGGGNDRYVHVVGLMINGGKPGLDFSCRAVKDLKVAVGSTDMFSISVSVAGGASCIERRSFALFSTPDGSWDQQQVLAAVTTPGQRVLSVVSLVIGHASLQYSVTSRREGAARSVSFSVSSTVFIPEGVVGYYYQCGDRKILMPFPGDIPGGKKKTRFGPILIPADSEVQVGPMDERFRANVDIQQKTLLGGLF